MSRKSGTSQKRYTPGEKTAGYGTERAKYTPGEKAAGHGTERAKYMPGEKAAKYEAEHAKYTPGSKTEERRQLQEAEAVAERSRETKEQPSGAEGVLQKIRTRRKKKIRRTLFAAASVLAVIYIGVAVYYGFHFYIGTEFYGIDCGNKTAKQVKSEAAEKLDKYVLEIEERDGQTETIDARQIGLTFEGGDSVDQMMKAQRAYLWPVTMLLDREQIDTVAFSYDRDKAQQVVSALGCMDSTRFVAPRDAYVGITDSGYEVVKEVMGTTVDSEQTAQTLFDALDAGETSLSLDEAGCYVNPGLYSDDEGLNRDAAAMSELARANIIYDFADRQEVVDVSVIDGWIVRLEDGTFTIDDTRVAQYVEDLASKYDTFGLERVFYTSIGTTVTLTGGDYGWCIDQDATTTALLKALDEGYQGTMEPVYLYTAMSRETNDIGYTYVEVCISQQRMWCYQYGNLIVDTPVVTGNPTKGNGTPSGGVWAIDAKMRDYVLKGEGYTAPVDYWMPFNGDVGIHDMQARAQFGGTIYLSNGSHGCVNTPYEQAQTIYNTVSIGTPVIVYE